jgi:hypothetical protein
MEDTAFLVVRRKDGTYYATPLFNEPVEVENVATRGDIKHGCQEILEVISQTDTAQLLADLIIDRLQPAPAETVSGSIREALDERGIL